MSIREVADLAGVAVSSVSRVLSGHPDVSPEMRRRVLRAVKASGYEPNQVAQSLRRGTSMSIGFIVGDVSNQLMSTIALAAETRLAESGYTLVLANSRGLPEGDAANLQLFRQRHVDGLLLSLTSETDRRVARLLKSFGKPAVILDREGGSRDASRVLFDHENGFRAATEYLVELGHRRIALIAGSLELRPNRERAAAVRRVMAEGGHKPPIVMAGSLSRAHGKASMVKLWSRTQRPTAVLCGGNQVLPGILEALRELQLRVPDDISLITSDNVELAEFHEPQLAAINRDAAGFGWAAAESLLRRIAGGVTDTVICPTSFSPAASCAPPRTRSTAGQDIA
jgi:LacI family transcriptional regulator